jgi:hypothetical protein
MISENRPGFPGPDEMSPREEREYAHDIERDARRDDERVVKWLIDLDDPTGQHAELSSVEQREGELRRKLREAQERVGKSDEDRMRWLFHLAASRGGELEDRQCEIFAFAVPPNARFVPCDVYATTGELSLYPAELYAWVGAGLDGLKDSIVEGRPFEWSVNAQESHHFTWLNGELVDRPSVDAPELTRDRFKVQVCNVLISQGQRVRLCQNCGKFFVGRKRQAYCTTKCSQIKRTMRYRETHPDRIREQRHEAYARKQRERLGPRVRVRKRPRRVKPSAGIDLNIHVRSPNGADSGMSVESG